MDKPYNVGKQLQSPIKNTVMFIDTDIENMGLFCGALRKQNINFHVFCDEKIIHCMKHKVYTVAMV